jgi:hypothetical protein
MRATLDPKDFVASQEDQEEMAAMRKSAKLAKLNPQKSSGEIQYYQFPVAVVDALLRANYGPAWALAFAVYKGRYRAKASEKSKPVKLTSALLDEFPVEGKRISKNPKLKALKILEQSGQFRVERSNGRNPLVTIK